MALPPSHSATRNSRFFARVSTRFVALSVVVLAAVLPTTLSGAGAQTTPNRDADEAQFVQLINDLRTSQGLQPLTVNQELVRVARGWTAKMKANGAISHNPNLSTEVQADWRKLGENVGVGPDVKILHEAFVKSPAHYRNLVDPAFDSIAITIEYDTSVFYVTEQFMDLDDRTSAPTSVATAKPTSGGAPTQLALAKPKTKKPTVKKTTTKKATTTKPAAK